MDRGYQRRQRMVGMLILIASAVATVACFAIVILVLAHFVIKFW